MASRSPRWRDRGLLIVLLAGPLSSCAVLPCTIPQQSQDEALLLMLSSYSLLEQMAAEPFAGRAGGRMALRWQASSRPNEARQLADGYQHIADSLPQDDETQRYYRERADAYYDRAREAGQERERAERRRQRGFFRWFGRQVRNAGNGLGRAMSGTMGVVGAVVEYVIEEELPRRIREAIRAEWERLRALAQGRIDAFWQRLAERYGADLTEYVRRRVDPLFIRLRDRVTGRAQRNARRTQTARAGGEAPTEPSEFQLPASGHWQLGCDFNRLTYTVVLNETGIVVAASADSSIDLDGRQFQVDLTGSAHSVDEDGVPDWQGVWNVTGNGQVTDDGLLYSAGRHVLDAAYLSSRYTTEATDYDFPITWIGAVAGDLHSVAFAVCSRPDYLPTLDQVRAGGRGAILNSPTICGGTSVLRCSVE